MKVFKPFRREFWKIRRGFREERISECTCMEKEQIRTLGELLEKIRNLAKGGKEQKSSLWGIWRFIESKSQSAPGTFHVLLTQMMGWFCFIPCALKSHNVQRDRTCSAVSHGLVPQTPRNRERGTNEITTRCCWFSCADPLRCGHVLPSIFPPRLAGVHPSTSNALSWVPVPKSITTNSRAYTMLYAPRTHRSPFRKAEGSKGSQTVLLWPLFLSDLQEPNLSKVSRKQHGVSLLQPIFPLLLAVSHWANWAQLLLKKICVEAKLIEERESSSELCYPVTIPAFTLPSSPDVHGNLSRELAGLWHWQSEKRQERARRSCPQGDLCSCPWQEPAHPHCHGDT